MSILHSRMPEIRLSSSVRKRMKQRCLNVKSRFTSAVESKGVFSSLRLDSTQVFLSPPEGISVRLATNWFIQRVPRLWLYSFSLVSSSRYLASECNLELYSERLNLHLGTPWLTIRSNFSSWARALLLLDMSPFVTVGDVFGFYSDIVENTITSN